MAYFFDNLKNSFDFFLRKNIAFSRKNYSEKPNDLSQYQKSELYCKLSEKYDLTLLNNSSKYNFLLNLYFLNIFDKSFSKDNFNKVSVLDIGCKNWEYAKSEYLFFKSFGDFVLDGIELDSNRLNSKFYSRYEVAKFHTKNLKNTNYISDDFLEHSRKYDYIIWILPFITEYPLIRWGLPLRYFSPEKMLSHAYNSLNEGGQMLIINQGESEYLIQKELNEKLSLKTQYFGKVEDEFNLFKNERYCCKVVK